MKNLLIKATDSLDSVMKKASGWTGGGTDCSLPMIHAKEIGMDQVDVFLTITDNETHSGQIHPVQSLKNYRAYRNKPDVKMVVMAVTSTGFSIADPTDPYNLDVVGFDSNVPALIADFVRGSSNDSVVELDNQEETTE